MKQLLLYFLFFIVSTLILIQCGKLFPSASKAKILQPHTIIKTPENINKSLNERMPNVIGKNEFQSSTMVPFFYDSYLPFRIIMNMNGNRRLQDQNMFSKQFGSTKNNNEILSQN